MPPRHVYWTILVGGSPTAFRAADRAELMPTFERLRAKQPDVAMKWFARGRLWDSQEEQRAAEGAPPRGSGESRGAEWRPGGAHRDPRDRFKTPTDRKDRDRRPPRSSDFKPQDASSDTPPPDGERAERPARRFDKPAWTPKPRPPFKPGGQDRPWSSRPPQGGDRRPWSGKPSGPPRGRDDRDARGGSGDRPEGRSRSDEGRPPFKPGNRPVRPPFKPGGSSGRPPFKPGGSGRPPFKPGGARPWSDKPPAGGDRRPWSGKPSGPPRPREGARDDRDRSDRPRPPFKPGGSGRPPFKPGGARPWSNKPPAGGDRRPWSGKPSGPPRPRDGARDDRDRSDRPRPPFKPGGARPWSDKPPSGGSRPPWGGKPAFRPRPDGEARRDRETPGDGSSRPPGRPPFKPGGSGRPPFKPGGSSGRPPYKPSGGTGRSWSSKPPQSRESRPWSDKPPSGGPRKPWNAPSGSRPPRPREDAPPRDDRPAREKPDERVERARKGNTRLMKKVKR